MIMMLHFLSSFFVCHCMAMVVFERERERDRGSDRSTSRSTAEKISDWSSTILSLSQGVERKRRRKFHTVHSICNLISLRWRRRTRWLIVRLIIITSWIYNVIHQGPWLLTVANLRSWTLCQVVDMLQTVLTLTATVWLAITRCTCSLVHLAYSHSHCTIR